MKKPILALAIAAVLGLAWAGTASAATPDAQFTASTSTPTVGEAVTYTAPSQSGVSFTWTANRTNPNTHANVVLARGDRQTFVYTPMNTDLHTILLVVSSGRVGPRAQYQVSYRAQPATVAALMSARPMATAASAGSVTCDSWWTGTPWVNLRYNIHCTGPFGWVRVRPHFTCATGALQIIHYEVTGPYATIASGGRSVSDLCPGLASSVHVDVA